jgi:hypothetical protein
VLSSITLDSPIGLGHKIVIEDYLSQGFGPDLTSPNFFNLTSQDFESFNIRSKKTTCSDQVYSAYNITNINRKTQDCVGVSIFAVPEFCKSIPGGPMIIQGYYESYEAVTRRIPYLVGVQSLGMNCGFGVPMIFSRVREFIPWIDSVMYSEENSRIANGVNLEIAREFEGKFYFNKKKQLEHTTKLHFRVNKIGKLKNHLLTRH